MHVPSLKKNLVLVAMFEDKGYDVFSAREKLSCDIKYQVKPRGYGFKLIISTSWRYMAMLQ